MAFDGKQEAEAFLREVYGDEFADDALKQAQENTEKQVEDAAIFFEVFGTGRGLELLEQLKDMTTNISVMENGVGDIAIPLNPGEFMARREGQNALIRFIEQQINIAKEGIK